MGTEYATRLMIVKGKFEALSMALYGEVLSGTAPPPLKYEPRSLPSTEPVALSRAVDPSNSSDPTALARELLTLLPDSPPLPLVVRLMFCLKPSDEDWDLPEFPYLHADLDVEMEEELDLENAIFFTSKPVRDDTPEESLSRFAIKVANCIGPKSSDQAYQIAMLLGISASQHPEMARALLQNLDVNSIFDSETLDESTILRLLDAATNVDIAQFLNNEYFLSLLKGVQENSRVDKSTQMAAKRLSTRIRQWQLFEDALSNTRGDFSEASDFLKDIGTQEQSMGIWLESMILHDDIAAKLAENAVLPVPHSHPPFLLRCTPITVSHDEFITFVRGYVGVASVLAVWAWADSLGNDVCRERTLAVLHLWQSVEGYREIVNHLLLLRQLTRRLEWVIADKDPPRKSGIIAERILVDLAREPSAILHDDLVQTILSLKPPLSFIAEHERLSLRKIALVAEDGLPAAVEELMFTSAHPLSQRRLRTVRASLAIVERELDNDSGEWRTTQAFWKEQSHAMVPRLIDLFIGVVADLNAHFVVSPPPRMNQSLVDQLFRTGDALLKLILRMTPILPLTSRGMRELVAAIADMFACTDAADMAYAQSSSACVSAQGVRQTCLDLVRGLSALGSYMEPGRLGAEVILRSLLEHAGRHGGRDPVYHLLQVFMLIDHVLPETNTVYEENDAHSIWVMDVLPKVLNEVKAFFCQLDTDSKVHLVKRLVTLDNGVLGMGEWLLLEEMKRFMNALVSLSDASLPMDYVNVLMHQASISLHLVFELATPSSSSSSWCLKALASMPDLTQALTNCLLMLLDGRYTSPYLPKLIEILASASETFVPEVAFTILLACLRVAQDESAQLHTVDTILSIIKTLPSAAFNTDALRLEIGQTLSAFAERSFDTDMAKGVMALLAWLPDQENPKFTSLCSITASQFSSLGDSLQKALPIEEHPALTELQSKFTIDEDESFITTNKELPTTLEFSLQSITDLLHLDMSSPPTTPKGTKTPDILGLIISPPTALLRSPAATGLTKTYVNNDFRQLRQAPSARQNTSRLPSMHVDVGINGRLAF
ncbi:hypothetical protein BDZ94DRAFT_1255296 [Collybia nuda]|uniref:Uncharacterized protein n=1 Tax=Collybia nuda TaxID=64659 RepID=A0A9P5Y9L5_9AGAR|nr:hypothetical protein BDZ94DRAFT_1255296 [Collybia nuda]